MDYLKLILFSFLIFSAQAVYAYVPTDTVSYSLTANNGITYVGTPESVCSNNTYLKTYWYPNIDPYPSGTSGGDCKLYNKTSGVYVSHFSILYTPTHSCPLGGSYNASTDNCDDPVCTGSTYLSNHQCVADPVCSSTEQLINHQCVADPVCSSTEQLINHQCVADPVCGSTEQLINHQCVADPVCSSTEQLINHQCVADPVCNSTEQLINHQCVADPTCSSTEQLINHQCVADPTCSTTELLINHQCVANQNLAQNNGDPNFFHNPQSVYYTQTVVGTTLVTKLDTSSGAILETQANDIPITPYVGLYWDPTDGYLYYSYKTQIDVGSKEKIPVSFKRRLSYDSMADMMVYYQLNSADFVVSNNNFQWLSDFFISRAEALGFDPFSLLARLNPWVNALYIIQAGFQIYQGVNGFFKKAPAGALSGSCTKAGDSTVYGTPQAVCDAININPKPTASMVDATRFVCTISSGTVGGGGCSSLGPAPDESISPGGVSNGISIRLKDSGRLGRLADAADVLSTMIDIAKGGYDLYKRFANSSPSSKKPLGDTPMPSTPRDYEPSFDKPAPPDLSKDNKTKADPVDLTKPKGGSTQTKPDGSQTTKDERIRIKSDPEFPDTIVAEHEITTTENWPDGSQNGGPTVEKRAPESSWEPDYSGDNNDPPPVDLCAKDPTIIACSHWGDPGTPEEIPTHEVEADFTPDGGDSGSCPSDKALSMKTVAGFSFSYAPVCQFAGYVKPIVVIFALIGAGYIMFGAVKES